ncbi:hypothetical protein HGA34_05935 [Candidatus Falkowbacteria bacterium]|nr:hypothetical protein [Candidatus Falkowbacteria bacterium]
MKKAKRFVAALSLFVAISSIVVFAPLAGYILTALSYAIHYFVLGLVWLLCQPVRLFIHGKRIFISYREPMPNYDWKPIRPLS